jgi:hypothetical protein
LLATYVDFNTLPPLPGVRGIKNDGALTAQLIEAGFANAAETLEETELQLGDEETWWASNWTHGARVPLERLPPDALDRLHTECLIRARAMKGPHGLTARDTFVYVSAEKPQPA